MQAFRCSCFFLLFFSVCFRYDRQVKRIKKKRVFESSGALGDSGRKVSTENGKESKKKKKHRQCEVGVQR